MRKSFVSGKVLGLWHSPVTSILNIIIVKSTTIGKWCLKDILFILVINSQFPWWRGGRAVRCSCLKPKVAFGTYIGYLHLYLELRGDLLPLVSAGAFFSFRYYTYIHIYTWIKVKCVFMKVDGMGLRIGCDWVVEQIPNLNIDLGLTNSNTNANHLPKRETFLTLQTNSMSTINSLHYYYPQAKILRQVWNWDQFHEIFK